LEMHRGDHHGERIYRLSNSGRTALFTALPYWQGAQQRLSSTLGEENWKTLLRLVDELCVATKDAAQLRTKNHFDSPQQLAG